MCSRFSLTHRIELAAKWRKILDPRGHLKNFVPKYNIAPTDETLVITYKNGEIEVDQMIFGLIPNWAKDAKMGLNCLNARSETITTKPSFREPFKKNRCLIPVDGYFEWQREGKQKRPYRFVRKDRAPFSLAGLWDEWKSPYGTLVHSFSIITTEPNALAGRIHDRMPVILAPEDEDKWLALGPENQTELLSLLRPFPPDQMESYRVSTKMNSSSYKEAEAIQPAAD